MAARLSRRKLAAYAADQLLGGAAAAPLLRQVAAYLIETKRTREFELLARDIEEALALRGETIVDVVSAHPLSDALKKEIKALAGAKIVHFRESIDSTVLGGVRIGLPGKRFDGTVRHKLNALKAKQL